MMKGGPPTSVVVPAALSGALIGGTVALLGATVQDFFTSGAVPLPVPFLMEGVLGFFMFLFGFVFLGVPAWTVAHYFGRTHWFDGTLIGALLSSIPSLLLTLPSGTTSASIGGKDMIVDGHFTPAGWWGELQLALIVAVAGAAAGWTIWRMVYRGT